MMPNMYYYRYPRVCRENYKKSKDRLIIVGGMGTVEVEPDIVILNMSVTTRGTDIIEVQDENKIIMNKVIEGLLRDGIRQTDIKTTQFSVSPRYDYVDGKQEFRGYEGYNSIQVTVRDMDKVGIIIENALKNGINNQRNLKYAVSDPEKYYEDALELAVVNAREKAQNIALTLHARINMQPIKVVEKTNRDQSGPRENFLVLEPGSPIQAGTMKIVAKVEAAFEY